LGEPRLGRSPGLEPSRARAAAEPKTFDDIDIARLPVSLLERIKLAAHKRDVPYQSLIKTWLAEKVDAPDAKGAIYFQIGLPEPGRP
jgi:hypothetical protein